MIGQLLAGRYRVVRVLGAGGFGETYVTEDLHLPGHPKCVLKHLKPASNDGKVLELARTLFEKEAIVLQQLGNHDRIPRLLAYFEEDREFYLVQEYIAGHPLSVELGRGKKWTDDRVINLLAEVLDILVFIHSQGVIHRDIKPDNIMRCDLDNKLVLIDFGAIKQVRNQPILSGQPTMTISIGTPGYMPIEQASGNPRPSSDIYALGAIGIQAVTGVDPSDLAEDEHTGERKWEHLAIANPQLIAILQRMTRYHFKDRYHTALEALQAVHALMAGTETQNATYVQAPPSQSPKSYYRPANIEERPTVAVAPPPRSSVTSTTTKRSQPPRQPRPTPKSSKFPLFAGSLFLLAAAGSFAFFSSQVFDRRKFQTDLTSPELCRLAAPTYLNSTKVRAEPDRDAKIIANLPRGTKVVYMSERNPFVQIRYTDGVGWVFNDQISSCNPPVSSPTPTPSVAPTKSVPVKPSPSLAPPVKPSPTPIDTPTPTPSVTPSASPTPSLPPSPTPQPSNSPTPTSTPTPEYIPGITEPQSPPPEPSPESSLKSNEKLGDVPNPDKSTPPEDKTPLW